MMVCIYKSSRECNRCPAARLCGDINMVIASVLDCDEFDHHVDWRERFVKQAEEEGIEKERINKFLRFVSELEIRGETLLG